MNIAVSGTLIDTPDRDHIRVRENHAFMVDRSGTISWTGHRSELPKGVEVEDYGDSLILPGLVDCHVHLAQYPFAGIGQGKLLNWLQDYTFPTEAKFSNPDVARRVSRQFFADLLKRGTTTAAVHVTSNPIATEIAFEEAMCSGIRVQMGQVHMDQNAPKELILDSLSGMESMERLFQKWHNCQGRLFYSVIPRFALSVSQPYLEQLGKFAKRHFLTVQTHIAESQDEISQVKMMFPAAEHYTDIYRQAELLGSKTLLAHGIYLSDSEVATIVDSGAHVVHCPSANRYLVSGCYPYRHRIRQGIKTLIGTDEGAGYTLNMISEMREAFETDKTHSIICDLFQPKPSQSALPWLSRETSELKPLENQRAIGQKDCEQGMDAKSWFEDKLPLAEILYAVTRRPHKIFHSSLLGLFDESAPADFIVIDDSLVDPFKDLGFYQDTLSRLRRVIYSDQIAVKETWIQGRCLYRKAI